MKYISVFFVLIAIILPVMAEESSDILRMSDFDISKVGLSFIKGELVKLDPAGDNFPMEIDFIFDMPHGLGMNNSVLTEWFPGHTYLVQTGDAEHYGKFLQFDAENELLEFTWISKKINKHHVQPFKKGLINNLCLYVKKHNTIIYQI